MGSPICKLWKREGQGALLLGDSRSRGGRHRTSESFHLTGLKGGLRETQVHGLIPGEDNSRSSPEGLLTLPFDEKAQRGTA